MTRLIMLSIDGKVLDEKSAVYARMQRYAALGYDLHVVLVAGRSKLVAFFKALRTCRSLARPGDVITSQDPFELGLLALIASRTKKCALHVQVHIDFYNPYFRSESMRQRFQSWIAPFIIRRADGVRAVSERIAAHIVRTLGVDERRVSVVPVFVDARAVMVAPITTDLHAMYPRFDWIFLVASRFVKQKNIPLAIDAFARFAKDHPKAGLVVIGSGREEHAIERAISRLPADVRDRAVVAPLANEFISCMKTCDAFVLSSDYEGWGMTVVEAAACARPIIMTDVGCAGEFVRDGENGLVVPTRDRDALVSAMEKVYSDGGLAARLGDKARASALAYMTVEENDREMRESWEGAKKVRCGLYSDL